MLTRHTFVKEINGTKIVEFWDGDILKGTVTWQTSTLSDEFKEMTRKWTDEGTMPNRAAAIREMDL